MNRDRLLWLCVATPITAWAAQLLLAYFIASLACSKGIALPVASHLVTVAALIATVGALLVTRRIRSDLGAGGAFLASVSALGAAVLLVGIALGELALLFVRGCA